jgi:hypothetical protein
MLDPSATTIARVNERSGGMMVVDPDAFPSVALVACPPVHPHSVAAAGAASAIATTSAALAFIRDVTHRCLRVVSPSASDPVATIGVGPASQLVALPQLAQWLVVQVRVPPPGASDRMLVTQFVEVASSVTFQWLKQSLVAYGLGYASHLDALARRVASDTAVRAALAGRTMEEYQRLRSKALGGVGMLVDRVGSIGVDAPGGVFALSVRSLREVVGTPVRDVAHEWSDAIASAPDQSTQLEAVRGAITSGVSPFPWDALLQMAEAVRQILMGQDEVVTRLGEWVCPHLPCPNVVTEDDDDEAALWGAAARRCAENLVEEADAEFVRAEFEEEVASLEASLRAELSYDVTWSCLCDPWKATLHVLSSDSTGCDLMEECGWILEGGRKEWNPLVQTSMLRSEESDVPSNEAPPAHEKARLLLESCRAETARAESLLRETEGVLQSVGPVTARRSPSRPPLSPKRVSGSAQQLRELLSAMRAERMSE